MYCLSFLAQVIVFGITAYIHIKMLYEKKLIIFIFSKRIFKKVFNYGIGYMPTKFAFWIFSSSDRYLYNLYDIYCRCRKYSFIAIFAMLINMIVDAIAVVYWPIYLNLMKKQNVDNKKKIEIFVFIAIYLIIFIF